MDGSGVVPLAAFDPGRTDNHNTRRARNVRGRNPAVLQAGVHASKTIEDANLRADAFQLQRDRAVVLANHTQDALRDIQEGLARAAASGTMAPAFAYVPLPDPFAAELLKRDAIIESWSAAFRDLVSVRERESAKSRAVLSTLFEDVRRAERDARASERKAAALALDLSSSHEVSNLDAAKIRDLGAKLVAAERFAQEQRILRREAQHSARASNDAREKAEARLASLLQSREAGQSRPSTTIAGRTGQLVHPLRPATVLPGQHRAGADGVYLAPATRQLLRAGNDSGSSDDERAAGASSPATSLASSARRRNDSSSPTPGGGNSPATSRQRRGSPSSDFTSSRAGSGPSSVT